MKEEIIWKAGHTYAAARVEARRGKFRVRAGASGYKPFRGTYDTIELLVEDAAEYFKTYGIFMGTPAELTAELNTANRLNYKEPTT